ncbi:hypothetical protein SEUCBS139899_000971 [Sporothrix eucalyptigena]|uniref:Uncharacterized protein n=1 Tax=Sporothrix eucalyptigena TaxID=1812306 RepID=A0ABP0C7W8_9PEZI
MPSTEIPMQQQPMAVNANSDIVTEQPTVQAQPEMQPDVSMRGGLFEECGCCGCEESCGCC